MFDELSKSFRNAKTLNKLFVTSVSVCESCLISIEKLFYFCAPFPMCFPCYSTRSGWTGFCFVFDSQREHRQKSFVQPSSSSFSALLVYGSFAGRILILTSSFLLLSAQSGFSLSSHPSPRFRLGRRSICFSRYQRSLSFLLRRSSMQTHLPFRYPSASRPWALGLTSLVTLCGRSAPSLARAGAVEGVGPSPGHDFLARSVFRARPAKVRFPRLSAVPHYWFLLSASCTGLRKAGACSFGSVDQSMPLVSVCSLCAFVLAAGTVGINFLGPLSVSFLLPNHLVLISTAVTRRSCSWATRSKNLSFLSSNCSHVMISQTRP
jgi:hypothetical protein